MPLILPLIGGKSGVIGAQPVEHEVEVVSKSDGKFTLEDMHSHMAVNGLHWDMRPTVVAKSAGITLLLTPIKTASMDLAMWRSQGINPEDFHVINVKAAVAHRQAYEPIAKASYFVNTAGPAPMTCARCSTQDCSGRCIRWMRCDVQLGKCLKIEDSFVEFRFSVIASRQ